MRIDKATWRHHVQVTMLKRSRYHHCTDLEGGEQLVAEQPDELQHPVDVHEGWEADEDDVVEAEQRDQHQRRPRQLPENSAGGRRD